MGVRVQQPEGGEQRGAADLRQSAGEVAAEQVARLT
jgi:hypothetical protein